MAITDLVAVLSAALAFLWISFSARDYKVEIKPVIESDELALLLSLQAGIHSAQSFDSLVGSLRLSEFVKATTWQRLASISERSSRFGISAGLLINDLISEIQNERVIQQKWKESIAAAKTASWLLFVIAFPLLAGASVSGLAITDWIFDHSVGRITFFIGFSISIFSIVRLKRASPFRKSGESRIPKLNASMASWLFGLGLFVLAPNFWGVLLVVVTMILIKNNWHRLSTLDEIQNSKELLQIRPRVVSELAAALTAGLDWKTSVNSVHVPENLKAEWTEIHQRISWGVSVPAAFSGSNWNQISSVVDQALRTGAPIANALFELAAHWRRASLSTVLTEIEQRASRNVVYVTLLQLPAFILMGLVPLVAASIFPLMEVFST